MSMPSTIGEVLASHAARDPAATAIAASGLPPLTFGDLQRHIDRIGCQLREAGITSSSRVGIALQRGPEAALLSVAVCCAATVLPINPNLPSSDLAVELERIRLDALIVAADVELPDWVRENPEGPGVFKVRRAHSSFDDIVLDQLRPVRQPRPAVPVTAQSPAAIFRTSGTTGVSKRVPVTHENLIEMASKMERWLNLGPVDRSACILPIYYNAGFKATLLVPLLIGCSVALPRSTSPQDFDHWLTELQPTWLTASPAFLQAIVDKLRLRASGVEPAPLGGSLRFVLSTASYLPEITRKALESLIPVPVIEFYGLCEAGMMTRPALSSDVGKGGSVGRAPEGELAIRDEAGALLPAGQTGQVVLRGPSVTPGYLLDDIDGVPTGLQDGWLLTGDLGILDKDGFLWIVGRSKEIINRGGEKISPYDVEKALLGHPAVREAAAFAVPHPRLGENVGAAVVLFPGVGATYSQLMDFIYDRLAPFQMPRHIHIVDSLPVGPTGKISRSRLSATFAGHRHSTARPAASLEILIADIWHRHLGRNDVGMDDDFFEIGGDSLQATEMLLELEETTHHRIAPSDIRASLTVRKLCETLTHAAAEKQELITKVKSGSGTPLFLCHGDFCGWGFYGIRLAELLKGDGPVYLLHSMLDVAEGIETIEQMAHSYLPHIQEVAPDGAIRLAGYCHGGLAALEVARCLERSGRTVENVVLVDTFSINARKAMRIIVPFVFFASRFVPGGAGRKLRRSGLPSLWRLVSHLLARDHAIARRVTRTIRTRKMQIWDGSRRTVYYRAMSRYLPPRIDAEMICLLSEEYSTKKEYDAGPWRNLARSVRSDGIPGGHNTCISRHVGDLAACINKMMAPGTPS